MSDKPFEKLVDETISKNARLYEKLASLKRYEYPIAWDGDHLQDAPGRGDWVRYEDAKSALAARDAEIEGLKRKLDLFRQMAEKINSLSSERLGEPFANAILGLLAAIDEATGDSK